HGRLTGPQVLTAGRNAAGMLAVSEAMAGDMAALGLPRERIAVHYTGLDRSRFRPTDKRQARRQLLERGIVTLAQDRPFIATVGALIPRKGQELVIRALAGLPGAVLGLVGKGPDEARLAALAQRLGVAGRVRFLGSLDHDTLPLVLSAADTMALPSASEGLANAWVEALACGTPIVISDAGGAAELLRSPEAGRIVPRDADAIASALRELIENAPAPEIVAQAAAPFSWETHAERLSAWFESLVQASPRAAFS
ncbi:MAG: putative teichuronic acid biosynthesis glycosyltransferase TuaC, partial [Pseudomonadota bacterium]